jgi:hypothetical protein
MTPAILRAGAIAARREADHLFASGKALGMYPDMAQHAINGATYWQAAANILAAMALAAETNENNGEQSDPVSDLRTDGQNNDDKHD